MKFHYLKSLSAVALAGMFAMNAYAETISEEYVIDFTQKDAGFKVNSFWGGLQDHMQVVTTDEGNLLLIDGVTVGEDGTPATNDAGYPSWSTMARIEGMTLPSGYNFSNVQLIEVDYKPTQPDGVAFAIQLRNATNPLYWGEDVAVGEWNTLAFDPAELTTGEENEPYTGAPGSFDFCFGANGSSNYYIKSITFYLEKEVTQREKDEAALDKSKAACVEFNFDNWEVSVDDENNFISCPYLGSNGDSRNRPDMIIDKGPEDYNNNCAHIIYQGWTQVFITEDVIVPEGYTFDDLRLVEYDVYETDIPGVNYTEPETQNSNRNGAPILKLKEWYAWGWCPNNDGSSCGNGPLPSVNEWHHVEFYPSAYEWRERDFNQNVVDENGDPVVDDNGDNVTEPVHWDADQVRDEFGKLTKFAISIGFFPCCCQSYVDNVKLWFQKGGEDAVETISAAQNGNGVLYNVYGQRVSEDYRGIVIKDGKKYIKK